MSERPDLSLTDAERRAFLADVLGDGAPLAYAVHGADGYPAVGLAEAVGDGEILRFVGDVPADGAIACCIVERGDTYDDITAVVARGTVRDRTLALDDVVSFEFAKLM